MAGFSLALAGVLVPSLASAAPAETRSAQARTKKQSLKALQRRHNRVLYKGMMNLLSRAAPNQERIMGDNTDPWGMTWTKCTNLGIHMVSSLVAEQQGLISAAEAKRQVKSVLSILGRLQTHHGIFPENIHIKDGIKAEVVDGKIRFSSIDAAWVTVALSIAEARYHTADPRIAEIARNMIARQDYGVFVGADGMLGAGFYIDAATDQKVESIAFSYSDRNSEARPLVLALWSMGQLPASAWENTRYEWGEREGLELANGWHFSAFVEMTGALFFDESRLAPESLGKSHQNYLEASIRVADREGHRLFGYAPSCDAVNAYAEFGLDRPDVVSPYAAALLTMTGDNRALANFSNLLEGLPRDGKPLPDGIDPRTGDVSCKVARSLDQGLMFLALNADAVRRLVKKTAWYPSAERQLQAMDRDFLIAQKAKQQAAEAGENVMIPANVAGPPAPDVPVAPAQK